MFEIFFRIIAVRALGFFLLAPAIAFFLTACNGGGNGTENDATQDGEEVEVPEQFSFFIELVPAVGYEPGRDIGTIIVTIHAEPPIVFEGIEVPYDGPFVFSFEMEPEQAQITAAVTVNGYRNELEGTIFSTGRCTPVRLGDYMVDPITGNVNSLKLFFHRLEEFSLMPEPYRLAFGRVGHRAMIGSNGKIVVVGGATLEGLTRVIELIDPGNLDFGFSTAEMPETRSEFAAVEVGESQWLLVGGRTPQTFAHFMTSDGDNVTFDTVALPEELQGVWANPRHAPLSDGSIIFTGADEGPETPSGIIASYDATGTLSLVTATMGGSDVELDKFHPSLTPVSMSGGERILIYGGGGFLPSALIFDPATGEMTDGGQAVMDGRYDHGAGSALMTSDDGAVENQAVLIMGGEERIDETTYEMAETVFVFIPACLEGPCIMSEAWSNAGPAFGDTPAKSGSMVVLPDSRVMHIGGRGADGEAVDAVVVITARTPTQFYAATLTLAVGRVAPEVLYYPSTEQLFVIGGEGEGGVPADSIEVFTPREEE